MEGWEVRASVSAAPERSSNMCTQPPQAPPWEEGIGSPSPGARPAAPAQACSVLASGPGFQSPHSGALKTCLFLPVCVCNHMGIFMASARLADQTCLMSFLTPSSCSPECPYEYPGGAARAGARSRRFPSRPSVSFVRHRSPLTGVPAPCGPQPQATERGLRGMSHGNRLKAILS